MHVDVPAPGGVCFNKKRMYRGMGGIKEVSQANEGWHIQFRQ